MAVSTLLATVRNLFREHETSSPDQGLNPAITSTDWTNLATKRVVCSFPADAAASSTGEYSLWSPSVAVNVTAAYLLPDAAVSSGASNFGVVTLGYGYTSGGGQATTLGSAIHSSAVSWVATERKSFAVSSTAVAAAKVVTAKVAKASAGVALPRCAVCIEYTDA
jgi:hypothetical protein